MDGGVWADKGERRRRRRRVLLGEKRRKFARRDENLSGLMNFISFNLDNGVEVKSHRRRSSSCCRLCRMWPVLYAGCALSTGSAAACSHQARKIKVSEFHVDAKYLKSVFGVCFVCFSRVRRPTSEFYSKGDGLCTSEQHTWNDHRHATHYGAAERIQQHQRHQRENSGCESAFKFFFLLSSAIAPELEVYHIKHSAHISTIKH